MRRTTLTAMVLWVALTGTALGQTEQDKAPVGPATTPSNMGANASPSTSSISCDPDKLTQDAEYCFDANRAGYRDLFDGSCNKSRDKTLAGFFACQAHNEEARRNFSGCTPDQQLDLVRSAGRTKHAYANLFACGF